MAPSRRTPWHVVAAAFALFALVGVSCSSGGSSSPTPQVHGILGFDERAARTAFTPPIAHAAFFPQDGDRTAVYGHWIIDCGHPDFHSEVHPPSFMSFAHQDGNTTVVHAFADPYYEDQLFNPDPSLANQLSNTARLSDADTVPF